MRKLSVFLVLFLMAGGLAFAAEDSANCVVFEEPDAALVGTFQGTIRWRDGNFASGSFDVKYTLKKVDTAWVMERSYNSPCTGPVKGPAPFKVYKDKLVSPDGKVAFTLKGGKVGCKFVDEYCEMKRL